MTLTPDTATSGCLSWPITTMLWWIVDFPSLLQKCWVARPIHQLSSSGTMIKRFPSFQDPPYYHVGLCWLREGWSGTISYTKAECRGGSRAELPTAERWCWLVHFGGQGSSSVAFHCFLLGIARGLICDGKRGSIAPDVLSHGRYRSCLHIPGCSHWMLDFLTSEAWDKEHQTTSKLHKALKLLLLRSCTFPGTVLGDGEFIKL